MSPIKRRKLTEIDQDHKTQSVDHISDSSSEDHDREDTSDEDIHIKKEKSRQTSKRKIRATGTSTFGATLQSLLSTEAPSALPLSLKPSITRQRNDEKLELRAKKVLQVEKKDKEDKGRIVDVIGGWGGEGERELRKIAQRGVVKLFNAIQQSQNQTLRLADDAKAARGSGKPTLPAPTIDDKASRKGRKTDSLSRNGKKAVTEDVFFDMIRSGGVVSKV